MWGRSSSQSQDATGIQTYRREEESLEDELGRLPKVEPVVNVSEGASKMVNSGEMETFAAELSRMVKGIDEAASCGQREIQLQVLHVEQQIGKMGSISKAMGQLAAMQAMFRKSPEQGQQSPIQLQARVDTLEQRIVDLQIAVDEVSLQHKRQIDADAHPSLLPVSFQASSSLSNELTEDYAASSAP